MNGVDLQELSKILGYSDLRMTDRYAHLSGAHLLGAARKLDGVLAQPRSRLKGLRWVCPVLSAHEALTLAAMTQRLALKIEVAENTVFRALRMSVWTSPHWIASGWPAIHPEHHEAPVQGSMSDLAWSHQSRTESNCPRCRLFGHVVCLPMPMSALEIRAH